VQTWVSSIVEEIVTKYDVDAIQFDDYFYYETASSLLQDDTTYQKYNTNFTTKADWRRNNTYSLVDTCHKKIAAVKTDVLFVV
ncbi:family 10 glycosylhydrolase, partial [Pseudomonas coronafaciens]|uniref:family 10 glycosylhydrolase n=1 Tax=Pseudomonas coronafaciens TaxID=53409 RepID=UPI0013C33C87